MYSFPKLLAAVAICLTCGISSANAQTAPATETAVALPQKIEAAPAPAPAEQSAEPAKTNSAADWLKNMEFEGNKKHLDMKAVHRTEEFIESWAKEKAINALSFSHLDFLDVQVEHRQFFTNAGFAEYQNVIKDLELDRLLQNRSYVVVAIARGEPAVVKHAPIKGAHRWLLYVPVVLSAFQADSDNNPTGEAKFTKSVDLSVQLLRVPYEAHEEEIMIESFKRKGGKK